MNKDNIGVSTIVLATGQENRMDSNIPKGLHNICGKPTAAYVIDAAKEVSRERPVLAVGDEPAVREYFGDSVDYALQKDGDALPTEHLKGDGYVIVIAANMPLVSAKMLEELAAKTKDNDLGVCIAKSKDDEAGSVYCFRIPELIEALANTDNGSVSDCAAYIADNGPGAETVYSDECAKVNDLVQLADVTAKIRKRINEKLMRSGVCLIDPQSTYIDAGVKIGRDTLVHPGVTIEGNSVIGEDVVLYPGSRIVDSQISSGSIVQNSVILEAVVGENTTIGPYAYLRPKSVIGNGCRVGDFVEVKNAQIKDGAKVSHLSYIGDGEIGENSNIGCGVVFVNYNGKKKSRTIIGKNAFVGCNVNLIAPVTVHDGAFVAAGSTITKDVDKDALGIARCEQKNFKGWAKKWRAK